MKTIEVSFRNEKVTEGNKPHAVAYGKSSNVFGLIRGLAGGRIRQLLGSVQITTTTEHEGYLMPLIKVKGELFGDLVAVKAGDKYAYTEEEIKAFAEQGVIIKGRKEVGSEAEEVQAGVEYIVSEDGFRVRDFNSLVFEPSEMTLDAMTKYVSPKAATVSSPSTMEA